VTAVVIYCDASVAKHVAPPLVGWGAVIVRNDVVIEASGCLPWTHGAHTPLAEIMAARLALEFALDRIVHSGDAVFIASDCDAVERYVLRRPKYPIQSYVNESARIERLARRRCLDLTVAHVKGHNGNNADVDPHTRFNSRADKLARIACGVRQS